MTYDELLCEAEIEGVEVIEMKFSGKIQGLYSDNVIALNKSIVTSKEKCCILAEELGHHFTSSGNILDCNNILNAKQEKRARRWAYRRLVGITDLINGYKAGTRNKYELAEYLNVTEEFLAHSLNYHKERHGPYYQLQNYIVYFDPLTVVERF